MRPTDGVGVRIWLSIVCFWLVVLVGAVWFGFVRDSRVDVLLWFGFCFWLPLLISVIWSVRRLSRVIYALRARDELLNGSDEIKRLKESAEWWLKATVIETVFTVFLTVLLLYLLSMKGIALNVMSELSPLKLIILLVLGAVLQAVGIILLSGRRPGRVMKSISEIAEIANEVLSSAREFLSWRWAIKVSCVMGLIVGFGGVTRPRIVGKFGGSLLMLTGIVSRGQYVACDEASSKYFNCVLHHFLNELASRYGVIVVVYTATAVVFWSLGWFVSRQIGVVKGSK